VILCAVWATARGAEQNAPAHETREFNVSVDGKQRGKCTIEIQSREDGSDTMHINAALNFNYVVYEYRYASAGSEVWKNGRLIELENEADYNGTKYSVKADSTKKGLRVTVNGKTSQAEPDVWVTSYWRLPEHLVRPDTAQRSGVIPTAGNRPARKGTPISVSLLDSDKGQKLRGEVERIAEETVAVAGRKKTCTHYKITGDVQVDVWYDSERRLVRQETVESGHKTVMELARITGE
jgi:hypothetical protein